MKKTLLIIVTFLFCVLNYVNQSGAATITGDGEWGDFIGDFSYSYESANEATVEITLKNTSPTNNRGYLTAFVFNIPDRFVTGVSMSCTDSDFRLLSGSDRKRGIKAVPYGYFDIGASVTDQFLGGGKPSNGIPPEFSETFKFFLTGHNLDSLDLQHFFSEMPTRGSRGKRSQFFVVRFRGFHNGCSDKTPGSQAVPIPSAVLLLASGLIALLVIKKRRRMETLSTSGRAIFM